MVIGVMAGEKGSPLTIMVGMADSAWGGGIEPSAEGGKGRHAMTMISAMCHK